MGTLCGLSPSQEGPSSGYIKHNSGQDTQGGRTTWLGQFWTSIGELAGWDAATGYGVPFDVVAHHMGSLLCPYDDECIGSRRYGNNYAIRRVCSYYPCIYM